MLVDRVSGGNAAALTGSPPNRAPVSDGFARVWGFFPEPSEGASNELVDSGVVDRVVHSLNAAPTAPSGGADNPLPETTQPRSESPIVRPGTSSAAIGSLPFGTLRTDEPMQEAFAPGASYVAVFVSLPVEASTTSPQTGTEGGGRMAVAPLAGPIASGDHPPQPEAAGAAFPAMTAGYAAPIAVQIPKDPPAGLRPTIAVPAAVRPTADTPAPDAASIGSRAAPQHSGQPTNLGRVAATPVNDLPPSTAAPVPSDASRKAGAENVPTRVGDGFPITADGPTLQTGLGAGNLAQSVVSTAMAAESMASTASEPVVNAATQPADAPTPEDPPPRQRPSDGPPTAARSSSAGIDAHQAMPVAARAQIPPALADGKSGLIAIGSGHSKNGRDSAQHQPESFAPISAPALMATVANGPDDLPAARLTDQGKSQSTAATGPGDPRPDPPTPPPPAKADRIRWAQSAPAPADEVPIHAQGPQGQPLTASVSGVRHAAVALVRTTQGLVVSPDSSMPAPDLTTAQASLTRFASVGTTQETTVEDMSLRPADRLDGSALAASSIADQRLALTARGATSPDADPQSPRANTPPPQAPLQGVSGPSFASLPGTRIDVSPEELGPVRLTLLQHADGLRVTVQAERHETLDLLRRNADALQAELRNVGYDGANLTFSRHGRQGSLPHQAADGPNAAIGGPDLAAEPPHPQVPHGLLDLRL